MSKLFRLVTSAALLALAFALSGTAPTAHAQPTQQPPPRAEKKKLKASSNFEQYAGRDASNRLIAGGATRGFDLCAAATQPNELYDCGMSRYGDGRYDDAIKAFAKLAELSPTNARAHFSLAATYEAAGKSKEAIEEYRAVTRLQPKQAVAHYNLGNVLASEKRYQEAVEEYKQVVSLAPDQYVAHYNLGLAYAGAGQSKEAIDAFKEAIRLKPDFEPAHYNLGIVYIKADKYEDASASFNEAVRLKPDHAEALFNLGLTKLVLTDADPSSLEEYKALSKMKPELAERLKKLAVEMKS